MTAATWTLVLFLFVYNDKAQSIGHNAVQVAGFTSQASCHDAGELVKSQSDLGTGLELPHGRVTQPWLAGFMCLPVK